MDTHMAFLPWHERYRVGHAELDGQHKKLFELVNHFDDVIQMDLADELGRIMEDLIAETAAHFKKEEELMLMVGFPKLSEHRKMHEDLLKQIKEVQTKMKAGGHVSTKSVVRFLADWLTNHILREDMELKPYL
jgi:hemerythrin-like metal-binding protein